MVLIWCHGRDPRPHERVNTCAGRTAGISPPRLSFLKTLRLVPWLTSFSPTSGYPSLDLDRHVYLVRAVHDGVHAFDHHLLQPGLRLHRLLCLALDDHSSYARGTRTARTVISTF